MNSNPTTTAPAFSFNLPDDWLETIAARVADSLADRLTPTIPEPWIPVDAAAAHLACKPPRIYDLVSRGVLEPHRDGTRLLFRRSDLDAYLQGENQ